MCVCLLSYALTSSVQILLESWPNCLNQTAQCSHWCQELHPCWLTRNSCFDTVVNGKKKKKMLSLEVCWIHNSNAFEKALKGRGSHIELPANHCARYDQECNTCVQHSFVINCLFSSLFLPPQIMLTDSSLINTIILVSKVVLDAMLTLKLSVL